MPNHMYDAVIVGASFAGLAVARRLGENVAIVDRKPLGSGQTSSCGAPLSTIENLGAGDAILQRHEALVIHTAGGVRSLPFREPFCTFDYQLLCQRLAAQVPGQFVRANVDALEGQCLSTTGGPLSGRAIVDASGWRATMASQLDPGFGDRYPLFCGVETEAPLREEGLHFWIEPAGARSLLAWVFPCGAFSRVGVGSYVGDHPLGTALDAFLAGLGVAGGPRHGGFLPGALRPPTVGHLFLVGDSAGQCYPLSGEGIRPALFFADACARLLSEVLAARIPFLDAIARYRQIVASHHWSFRIMRRMQNLLLALPPTAQDLLVRAAAVPAVADRLQWAYDRAIPSAPLRL